MSDKAFYCKVCEAPARRRKRYQPSTCEACRKFFVRTCQQFLEDNVPLVCSYDSQCAVQSNTRRECKKCRFDKCLAAGLKSKFLRQKPGQDIKCEPTSTSSQGEVSDKQETSPSLSPTDTTACVPFVYDPVIFDGSAVESVLKTTVKAFTQLHGFEFLAMKRTMEPVNDFGQFMELQKAAVLPIMSIGLSYGQNFVASEGFEDLSQADAHILLMTSISQILAMFTNLPGNPGASFSGLSDALLPTLFQYFPEFKSSLNAYKKLSDALEKWRPTLVEASLLSGLLFFSSNEQVAMMAGNQRVLKAFWRRALLTANVFLGRIKSEDCDDRRRHMEKCFQLAQIAGNEGVKCSVALSKIDSQYSIAFRQMAPDNFNYIIE